MADPRSTSTRRAVLSYDQLKELTRSSGVVWPDLLVKDYQGIFPDFVFLSDEVDALEARVDGLEVRIEELEARVFRTVNVTENVTALSFQVVLCDNTSPIEVTLNPDADKDDMIHVMRRNDEVMTIGLIDGDSTGRIFNVRYQSELYIFDGVGWSAI